MTFDHLKKVSNHITIGDYIKFAKDFDLPLKKEDLSEVFRQKSTRSGNKVDFDVF